MTRELGEKFEYPFSHLFMYDNTFHESHGFVAMTVIISVSLRSLIDRDKLEKIFPMVSTVHFYKRIYLINNK